ncbi:MAG: enoyl-CoA hydratase [Actinomycetota bacterium]
MESPERVRYDVPSEGVARVTLARGDEWNQQDMHMLYQIDAAYLRAAADPAIKVVILAADGDHFSYGHDIGALFSSDGIVPRGFPTIVETPGVEGTMAWEEEVFLGLCWRWRNFPKPIIAQVQGAVMSGGLMLIWPTDIIVASDTAIFADPVVALGLNGVELFFHPWELGPRRAKEMLFTGDPVSAADAHRLGMVNHVVPLEELEAKTLEIAQKIALRPSFGLKLAKQSVNAALDAQGQEAAVKSAFALQQVGHAHNRLISDQYIDPAGLVLLGSPPLDASVPF